MNILSKPNLLFNFKDYIEKYNDLNKQNPQITELDAWKHFILHGINKIEILQS